MPEQPVPPANYFRMTLGTFALLAGGLLLVSVGAEGLVRGASQLATAMGVPALLVGLTVVAVGTSAPEIVVTVRLALAGQPDLALGNVVGSNIFNVLLILGVSALVVPLVVARQVVRRDVPVMVGVSALVFLLALDGALARWEGALLVAIGAGYTAYLVVAGRRERADVEIGTLRTGYAEPRRIVRSAGVLLVGLVLLLVGASWFIEGSMAVARAFEVPELVIGLTLVAGGTSLPEVAASLAAAFRGERGLAVGNVVGSNLYNLTLVLGLGSVMSVGGLPVPAAALAFDLPFMTIVAAACLPIFFTGARIDRWEGTIFLVYYVGYVTFLLINATAHQHLALFSSTMLYFVTPLAVLTLIVVGVREWRGSTEPGGGG